MWPSSTVESHVIWGCKMVEVAHLAERTRSFKQLDLPGTLLRY